MKNFLICLAALAQIVYTNAAPKIVGGVDAVEGRFPYFVSLLADVCLLPAGLSEIGAGAPESQREAFARLDAAYQSRAQSCSSGSVMIRICGGTLVAFDAVATAGHCFLEVSGVFFPSHVRLGDFDDSSEGVNEKEASVRVLHPAFALEPVLVNDFMMIKLADPFAASAPTVTVGEDLIDTATATAEDLTFTVIGLGLLEEYDGGPALTPDTLQVVDVSLVTDNVCASQYGGAYQKNIMICAADTGKDSCQGDSGGPILLAGAAADGSQDVQVGFVSFGNGCARPDFAGIYSRASAGFDFIAEVIAANINDLEDASGEDSGAVSTNGVLKMFAVVAAAGMLLL